MVDVYILTWVQRIELLYAAQLIFNSVRVGFKSSRIHVFDSASVPAARAPLRQFADACGAHYTQLDRHVELADFMTQVIFKQNSGAAVFVDPDVCFWQSVEHWQFEGLAAGRFIPRHICDFTSCITEPRLHSSLFWVPDVTRLRNAIIDARKRHRFFQPFQTMMLPGNGHWRFFDTPAGLYGAFPKEMEHFTEEQLDCYDHLFSGSFADSVLAKLRPDFQGMYREIHHLAQTDYRQLKGCWRRQEEYFKARSC